MSTPKMVIENVKSFQILNGDLYFSNQNEVFINSYENKLYESKEQLQEVRKSENKIFVNTIYGQGILISKNCAEIKDFIQYASEKFIICTHREDDKKISIIRDYKNFEKKGEIDQSSTIIHIHDNTYFRKNFTTNNAEAFSLPSGNHLWTFEIQDLGFFNLDNGEQKPYKIAKFIGVWKEQLIVLLDFGTYVGLDFKTGKLLWTKNSFDQNRTNQTLDNFRFIWPKSPLLNEEKQEIYILQEDYFISWDLNSMQAEYKYDGRTLPIEDQFVFEQSRYIGDNLIYFVGSKTEEEKSFMNYIGLFDISKNEVVWYWRTPENNLFSIGQDDIQANDKNLYALDRAGNLYVFERDELKTN